MPRSKVYSTRSERADLRGLHGVAGPRPHEQEAEQLLCVQRPEVSLAGFELAELKQFQNADDEETLAMFTLMCLPKGKKK